MKIDYTKTELFMTAENKEDENLIDEIGNCLRLGLSIRVSSVRFANDKQKIGPRTRVSKTAAELLQSGVCPKIPITARAGPASEKSPGEPPSI